MPRRLLAVPAVLLAATALASCASGRGKANPSGGASGAAVVDVRENGSGRHHIPASQMSRRWDELEEFRAEPLTVRASSRTEANRAAAVLRSQGFQAVRIEVAE